MISKGEGDADRSHHQVQRGLPSLVMNRSMSQRRTKNIKKKCPGPTNQQFNIS